MKINRALGLGLLILILQLLAASIWFSLEQTVITVFDVTRSALGAAEAGLEHLPDLTAPLVPASTSQ
jgi:hypothetical protein